MQLYLLLTLLLASIAPLFAAPTTNAKTDSTNLETVHVSSHGNSSFIGNCVCAVTWVSENRPVKDDTPQTFTNQTTTTTTTVFGSASSTASTSADSDYILPLLKDEGRCRLSVTLKDSFNQETTSWQAIDNALATSLYSLLQDTSSNPSHSAAEGTMPPVDVGEQSGIQVVLAWVE